MCVCVCVCVCVTYRGPSEDGGPTHSGRVDLLVSVVEVLTPHLTVHVSIHPTDDDDGRVEGSGACRDLQRGSCYTHTHMHTHTHTHTHTHALLTAVAHSPRSLA